MDASLLKAKTALKTVISVYCKRASFVGGKGREREKEKENGERKE